MMSSAQLKMVHVYGVASLIVLSLAAWFFAIQPSLNSRAVYHEVVAQRERAREALRDAEAQAQEAMLRLTALQESLKSRPLVLGGQDDLSKKLQQITDLSTKVGLQLSSIEAGKSDNYSRHGTVAIQMTARCTLVSLWTFFRDLRREMPDMTVRSIDLAGRYINKDSMPGLTMALVWHTAPTRQVALR